MDLTPEVSRQIFEEGAFLVVLGAPRGSCFGIDFKSWNTETEFRGFKMIPPGLHFVHYSASDPDTGDVAPRIGFMHYFKPKELMVKTWDDEKEDLSSNVPTEETIHRIRSNIYTLDKYLAPYPYDILQKWISLSSHITDNLISKLTPENGQIRSALELFSCNNDDRPRGINRKVSKTDNKSENEQQKNDSESSDGKNVDANVENIAESSSGTSTQIEKDGKETKVKRRSRTLTIEEKEQQLLPHLKPAAGSEIRFSVFPEQVYPPNSTPAEITKHHLDQTYVLDVMMQRYSSQMEILGEMEFAYVCFLIGHSLDAFEYWKKLVRLFCSCEEAIKKYRQVYVQFIKSLEVQLMEIPEEFLADIVMNENYVYVTLRSFFKTVYSSNIESSLKSAIERFQFNLTEKFMWNFTNLGVDEDDELPVIVHL